MATMVVAMNSGLDCNSAFAQLSVPSSQMVLYERSAEIQSYRLSNPRMQKNKDGKTVLIFKTEKLVEGTLANEDLFLRVPATGQDYKMVVPPWVSAGKDSTIVLAEDSEAAVRQQGAIMYASGEISGARFLISNALNFGNASQGVTPIPMGPEQRDIVAKAVQREKDAGPKHAGAPADYTLVKHARPAVPGMPARAFLDGAWNDAEFLGYDGFNRVVYRPSRVSRDVVVTESFNVAVSNELIAIANKNMQAFKPSLELVPGSAIVVPEGFKLKETSTPLFPGTPVRVHLVDGFGKGRFYDGFVVEATFDPKVKGKHIPGGVINHSKHKIMLPEAVKQRLQTSTAEEAKAYFAKFIAPDVDVTPMQAAGVPELEIPASTYATFADIPAIPKAHEDAINRLKAIQAQSGTTASDRTENASTRTGISTANSVSNRPARVLKSYPVEIPPLPKTSIVSMDLPLKPGIGLACSWASKWSPVTVLAAHDDGAVRIRWNQYGANWDCDVARSSLIVRDVDKRKLIRLQDAPEMNPRVWKDSSGKFSVTAFFQSANDQSVRLAKTDGTIVEIPVEKLSEQDKQVVNDRRVQEQ